MYQFIIEKCTVSREESYTPIFRLLGTYINTLESRFSAFTDLALNFKSETEFSTGLYPA